MNHFVFFAHKYFAGPTLLGAHVVSAPHLTKPPQINMVRHFKGHLGRNRKGPAVEDLAFWQRLPIPPARRSLVTIKPLNICKP